MKTLWYYIIKLYIKAGLFFYTKKIRVTGRENIPKKGAVLFAVNHPNGLLDPLVVATNTPRFCHFLVRAAVFKNPLVKKILGTLNLMPIYRIRDGREELSKNTQIFNNCFDILNSQKALMIFPEGSHDKRRTIRTLSKGFTRIVFGAIEKFPSLQIQIVPVGITYQHAGSFPSKIALCFGTPILANKYYNAELLNESTSSLKKAVSEQLKELSVHIPTDENYQKTLEKFNKNNTDFTKVAETNNAILHNDFSKKENTSNSLKAVYFLWITNSIFPWLIWKKIATKIDEIEFIDTFKFTLEISVFPIFYSMQTLLIYFLFGLKIALFYTVFTIFITLIYTKFSATLPKAHPE